MKKYYVKLEQIVRIGRWFTAENDEEAMEKAKLIHLQTDDSEFENGSGEREYDYSLVDENGNDLIYWG